MFIVRVCTNDKYQNLEVGFVPMAAFFG